MVIQKATRDGLRNDVPEISNTNRDGITRVHVLITRVRMVNKEPLGLR